MGRPGDRVADADRPSAGTSDFAPNDRPTFPAHRKRYPEGLPSVELPAAWAPVLAPTIDLLAGRYSTVSTPLDLGGLARLLHLSAGVVRVAVRRDGRRFLFRPAGSAGGLFPSSSTSPRVASPGCAMPSTGTTRWHLAQEVAPRATGDATTVVVTGIPWRTGWRYAERGLRHIYWDAGTMLANTLALAELGGYQPRLLTRFPDAAVARLVGADGTQELPLAVVVWAAVRRRSAPAARQRSARSTWRRSSSRSCRSPSTPGTTSGSACRRPSRRRSTATCR